MTRPRDLARINLIDATTLAANIDLALTNLNDSLGGYPNHTPGAAPLLATGPTECGRHDCTNTRPCPDHDDNTPLTTVERAATNNDRATTDLEQLIKALKAAHTFTARAAQLANRWARPAINDTTVTRRLGATDTDIWCRNCVRHGQRNPREHERTECSFCAGFRQTYGLDAPQAIMNARDARGGRIDTITIERLLDRDHPGWRKQRPKQKTKAAS